jgi:FlaA1/EpsC-like NDP-sugar epimerase
MPSYTADVIPGLKTLDWSGFLARPSVGQPPARLLEELREAAILVVGAGGSIGSALALRLAVLDAPALILLESSERNLYALEREFAEAGFAERTIFLLGSVTDCVLLEEIFGVHAPRLVFHAAAFKHVPLLEKQPLAAIGNNVFGTLSLVAAAGGARVVLLSTDKAAAPASVMGATKRIAEQIVLGDGGTAVRLGNVLASQGSVAEVFAEQIAVGGPITVTSPAARRYFLTVDEAVNLLLWAAVEPGLAPLLAPKLPAPQFVSDLARFMAAALAPGREIPVAFTGLRPGDKEMEQFRSAGESVRAAATASMIRIESRTQPTGQLHSLLSELRVAHDARDLPAAVIAMRRLVPDFAPSPTLLALAGESKPRLAV